MGLETRTPGEIIDLLITVNIKCFMAQDNISNPDLSFEDRYKASQLAHRLNNRRNQLIISLDKILGYGEFTQLEKTYNEQFKKNE